MSAATPATTDSTVGAGIRSLRGRDPGVWPGLLLASAVALAALALGRVPGLTGFSPLILAIVIGIVFRAVAGMPARVATGMSPRSSGVTTRVSGVAGGAVSGCREFSHAVSPQGRWWPPGDQR